MASQMAIREEATLTGILRGTIAAFDRDGRPLVRSARTAAVVCCDRLEVGLGAGELSLGDAVVFSTYSDEPSLGCILGRIEPPPGANAVARKRTLRLDLDELIVEARTRVSVRAGRARLLLTGAGDLELMATSIVSKARRVQRLLAPMLRLN